MKLGSKAKEGPKKTEGNEWARESCDKYALQQELQPNDKVPSVEE